VKVLREFNLHTNSAALFNLLSQDWSAGNAGMPQTALPGIFAPESKEA
jgi:hypothetical protein